MAVSVVMPGPGSVVRWLKRAGAWVQAGEPVVQVAVQGAARALPAPAAGMVTALLCPDGQPAEAGADLAYIQAAVRGPGPETLLPWTDVRQRIARNMQYSTVAAAHITTGVEVDLSLVRDLRAGLRARGVPLSLTAFFVAAAAAALRDWPCVNGQVTPAGLLLPDAVHITMPVAAPAGVHPVVLRNAPLKTVSQLDAELQHLAMLARAGRSGPELTDGGTFTVTNPGALGSVWGTAVINQPNCAIMSCHATVERPVATRDRRVEVRPMANLTLSFDHRALDGSVTLGFLGQVRELLAGARLHI